MLYEILGFKDFEFPAGLGWHDRVAQGFPQSSLWAVARHLKVEPKDVAELLGFPQEALNWRERGANIGPELSDVLFRIALAIHRLHAVFKDDELVVNWLRNARKETNGQIPILLLTTTPGAQLVLSVIDRIKPVKKLMADAPVEASAHDDEQEDGDDAVEQED